MNKLILIILLIPFQLFAQQETQWIKSIESPNDSNSLLKEENVMDQYKHLDFSELIKPKTEFLGFIGTKFRRIDLEFVEVEKIKDLYKVVGFSIVSSNKCDFDGEIRIKQIRELKSLHFGVDNIYKDSNIVVQGVLIAEYEFKENPQQKHVGVFNGVMTLWWYLDANNDLQYDNILIHTDSYSNNQYVGSWSEYGTDESRPCNWGEYRIPLSGDLDIGTKEFFPNSKYKDMGWDAY
jgi:hypothetical protein